MLWKKVADKVVSLFLSILVHVLESARSGFFILRRYFLSTLPVPRGSNCLSVRLLSLGPAVHSIAVPCTRRFFYE